MTEIKNYKKYNTEIEYIRPGDDLGSSFARITEHIGYIKSCENKFYWLGILGDSESWGHEVWKIIESWCSQLIDIIGDCSRIRVRYINKEEDILI